jgi:hypothetical protein
MINAQGLVTTYSYQSSYDMLGPLGGIVTYTYDYIDAITAPGGLVTTYTYDYMGSLAPSMTNPLLYNLQYHYDLTGPGVSESQTTTSTLGASPVPDPTGGGLVALGLMALLRPRRRAARRDRG